MTVPVRVRTDSKWRWTCVILESRGNKEEGKSERDSTIVSKTELVSPFDPAVFSHSDALRETSALRISHCDAEAENIWDCSSQHVGP